MLSTAGGATPPVRARPAMRGGLGCSRACRYDFLGSFVTGSMFRLCASFVTQSENETTTADARI